MLNLQSKKKELSIFNNILWKVQILLYDDWFYIIKEDKTAHYAFNSTSVSLRQAKGNSILTYLVIQHAMQWNITSKTEESS